MGNAAPGSCCAEEEERQRHNRHSRATSVADLEAEQGALVRRHEQASRLRGWLEERGMAEYMPTLVRERVTLADLIGGNLSAADLRAIGLPFMDARPPSDK